MRSLRALFGFRPAAPAAPPAAARSAASPAAEADSPLAAPAFGARSPLLDTNGRVAGFEFRLAPAVTRRLSQRDADPAQGAHLIALLSAMRPTADARRLAYASVPAEWLARDAVAAHVPAGVWLLPDTTAPVEPSRLTALAGLQARGVRLGQMLASSGTGPESGWRPDFFVVRVGDDRIENLTDSLRRQRQAPRPVPVVVLDIPNIEQLEAVLQVGASYAGGRLDSAAAPRESRPLRAGTQRLCGLLNDLISDRDADQVAASLRADVALSYRLLRQVNSAAAGLSRPVDSIEQGVALLGRNELYRWLSVLLATSGDSRPSSRALHEVALARARLLELLGGGGTDAPPGALFTVGLLSLLGPMLQMSQAQALEPLRLGDLSRQALLDHAGPWHAPLALAEALERHDDEAVERLSAAFGGSAAVHAAADEAWRWAAEVAQQLQA